MAERSSRSPCEKRALEASQPSAPTSSRFPASRWNLSTKEALRRRLQSGVWALGSARMNSGAAATTGNATHINTTYAYAMALCDPTFAARGEFRRKVNNCAAFSYFSTAPIANRRSGRGSWMRQAQVNAERIGLFRHALQQHDFLFDVRFATNGVVFIDRARVSPPPRRRAAHFSCNGLVAVDTDAGQRRSDTARQRQHREQTPRPCHHRFRE